MRLVAGVDSSTQSCKVVIRELGSGEVLRSGRAAHPAGTEVDPAAWWQALLEAIADAGGLADVAAISIAAQEHGMVVLDANGQVIRPALLWNDTRGAGAARNLVHKVGAAEFEQRVGVVPVASLMLTKLRWLRDAEPQNAERVAAVALAHHWLSWRLRGYGPEGQAALGPQLDQLASDRSDASGTAYFSAVTGTYDLDLFLRGLGRDDVVLPRVLSTAEAAGETARAVVADTAGPASSGSDAIVPPGILIAAGAGDNAAAALGLGARTGDVVVPVGTSGTVFAVTDTPARDASGVVAGFADASGRYLPLIATLNATRVLDCAARLLSTDQEGLDALALSSEPGAHGVVMLPYFEGERTPNLPEATASLHGLSTGSSSRENIARAAVEGMLCSLADRLDAIRRTGVDPERLLLIGGSARSRAVRRVTAQVFELAVTVPSPGEYVAAGDAVQAAWALTSERPSWASSIDPEVAADHQPVIREQYSRYAALERQAVEGRIVELSTATDRQSH